MLKILIVVNTYYQLIIAINLKQTLLKYENVDLIVSNVSVSSDVICNNLKMINCFNNVEFFDVKCVFLKKNLFEKIMLLTNTVTGKFHNIFSDINKIDNNYNEILFYNIDYFITTLSVMNKNCCNLSRFEEGYVSYYYSQPKPSKKVQLIFNYKILDKCMDKYYFFEPDLATVSDYNYNYQQMPKIDANNKELVTILNKTFGVETLEDKYDKKYIFFEQCFLDDGIEMQDFELVMKIAEIVGKENLMVKLHPRTQKDRFKEYEIVTNSNTAVPWEVIQMNNDFSDNVFITISSGSVISPKLIFDKDVKTFFLGGFMEERLDEKFKDFMHRFSQKYDTSSIRMPSDMNTFISELKEYHEGFINETTTK